MPSGKRRKQTSPGKQSYLLFEWRQSLDLINYYRSKNNQPALEKELAHLRLIEGRLTSWAPPNRLHGITDEDLAKAGGIYQEVNSGF